MKRIAIALGVCLALFSFEALADGNLSADQIQVTVLGNGNYEFVVYHSASWTAAQGDFGYKVKVEHWRNGAVIATPLDDLIELVLDPQRVCPTACGNITCSGVCHYKPKGGKVWLEGACGRGTKNCDTTNDKKCTCKKSSHNTLELGIISGDTIVFSIEDDYNFNDWDLTDNSLSVQL